MTVNTTKTPPAPPPPSLAGPRPYTGKNRLLAEFGAGVRHADGAVVVGVPVVFDTFVERHALDIIRKGGARNWPGFLYVCPTNREQY